MSRLQWAEHQWGVTAIWRLLMEDRWWVIVGWGLALAWSVAVWYVVIRAVKLWLLS